jgi:prolyl oligopeptidase
MIVGSIMRSRALRSLVVLGLGLGCAGQEAPATSGRKLARPAASSLPSELAALNAELRRGAQREIVSGIEVDDPYRALERDTPETRRWMDAQTARTERELAARHDASAEGRLRDLLSIGVIDELSLGGERVFFTAREGARERPALYMIDAGTRHALDRDRPLVDPASYGPRASLDYAYPSPDGRFVAFGISDNGDERSTLRVIDIDQSRLLPDRLEHAKWSSLAWLPDGAGFYYSRYPRADEPGYDAAHEDSYFSRVFFHRLGDEPGRDALVFAGAEKTTFSSPTLDETGRYLVINDFRSWTASDVWLWDRGERRGEHDARAVAPLPGELRPVIRGEEAVSSGQVRAGQLYLLTTLDAPRRRVLRVPAALASERARWQELIPEGPTSIEDAAFGTHALVLQAIDDVQSRLTTYAADGGTPNTVTLPTRGSISSMALAPDGSRLCFVWSSFFHPPALYTYDTRSQTLTRVFQVQHDIDPDAFVLERVRARSLDGTPVDLSFIHRKGLPRNGSAPVLIEGYGGFSVSLLPDLRRSALHFAERGGIYAVATLRGGGEHGEAFHRAGMLDEKPRVFEDFEAAIDWFAHSGWSRPSRIAITGGSNGGLLIGAMLTRSPQRFGAALAYVGLYDMLRYTRFPPAELWVSEYGDPTDPTVARYLHAYSPYHNVKAATAYPATLIETADHDTRVFWGHSTKFAARLQDAAVGPAPVYFFMERKSGHGPGLGLADLVRREARKHAFLRGALGL